MVEECWGTVVVFGERRSRQKQQNQGQRADIRRYLEMVGAGLMVNDNYAKFVAKRGCLYSNSGPLEANQKLGLAGASL